MAIKRLKIVADFETTVDPDDVRVWAVCAVDIETSDTLFLDNSIDSFFHWLENKNTICYFHNLKFDGEFILSYLLQNGYKYSEERENRTFSTLISDMGVFYSIEVIFERKNKTFKKVVFYDSLKKLPFKVSVISKAFHLTDEKLSIDYKATRPVGHVLTEEEKQYIVNDCRIVAQALKIQFDQGLKRMTNASDAMGNFKEIITPKMFDRYFPVFPIEMDTDIRGAYKGGFTYLSPKYKGKRGLQGIRLDVNSLYPSVMYDRPLPYSYPMYFEGEPNPDEVFNLFVVRFECAFDLKEDHIPTVQLKRNLAFIPTEYVETTDGEIVEMVMTSVDLQLFFDHYDVYDLTYISGWKFRSITGVFKPYIDYWNEIKANNTGALRQLAKLMLNSLYGKFATNPRSATKTPLLDTDQIVRYTAKDDMRDPVYTAMGAFITAYAREKTIRTAQEVYDRFIYADTDSLHLIGYDEPDVDIHPTRLGAWKNEGKFCDSKYIRQKTYMETMIIDVPATLKAYCKILNDDRIETAFHLNGRIYYTEIEVKCAGMPDNIKEHITYDNFCVGSSFDGKLVPKRCKGGVILTETTFTIK